MKLSQNSDTILSSEDQFLFLHVDASLINHHRPPVSEQKKKDWRLNRDHFLGEFKKYTSALRNSGGGAIFVHIHDLDVADSYLDHFHELVDSKLNDLIEDGSLFVQVYKKNWLTCVEENINEEDCDLGRNTGGGIDQNQYRSVVSVTVIPSLTVVTVDFKTKLPLDNSIIDPRNSDIVQFLSRKIPFQDTTSKIRGLKELRESRSIEVKGFKFKDCDQHIERELLKNPSKLADYIWDRAKIGHYLSAFTKIDGGGSFYLGILEREKTYDAYKSKVYKTTGIAVPLEEHSKLKDLIKEKIGAETLVLPFDVEAQPKPFSPDTVKIEFHQVRDKLFVLEVAVPAVNGLMFYHRAGPEAYYMYKNESPRRLELLEWQRRLLSCNIIFGLV